MRPRCCRCPARGSANPGPPPGRPAALQGRRAGRRAEDRRPDRWHGGRPARAEGASRSSQRSRAAWRAWRAAGPGASAASRRSPLTVRRSRTETAPWRRHPWRRPPRRDARRASLGSDRAPRRSGCAGSPGPRPPPPRTPPPIMWSAMLRHHALTGIAPALLLAARLSTAGAAPTPPALPEQIPTEERARLMRVAEAASVSTHVDAEPFVSRAVVFEYLLDHPEFA